MELLLTALIALSLERHRMALQLHRGVVQPGPIAFGAGLPIAYGL
jgi:hypothetical protein